MMRGVVRGVESPSRPCLSVRNLKPSIFCRDLDGLVGPRALVAQQEHLADEDAVDARPVRRPGRRPPPLHPDAQEPAGAAARLALSGHESGLFG